MINAKQEDLLSLRAAAAGLPRRRAGKRPHVATVYRWAKRGLRGVVLETLQVGGTLCTSQEALQRFFEALTAPGRVSAARAVTNDQDRVEAELERHEL